MCNTCQKVYKTAAGLSRHISQKHSSSSSSSTSSSSSEKKHYNKLEPSKFDEIFKESVDSLAKDECYPEYIKDPFKTVVMENMRPNNNLYEDVVVIYEKHPKISDLEKFFSAFYGKIVLKSKKYVGVKNPQSTLITSKITEKLLHYFKLFQQDGEGSSLSSSNVEQHASLSERELHGQQYLAGYAVSNLMKNVTNDKNNSSLENQYALPIVDASITKDISNQKLIRSLSRGGLSVFNNQCINKFLIMEKHFRNVAKKINLQKISIDEIINYLVKNPDVVSNCNSFSTQTNGTISKEISKNVLEKMLRLYIRVKSFSCAKDVNFKKILLSRTTNKKSLRTNLKKKSDQEIIDP